MELNSTALRQNVGLPLSLWWGTWALSARWSPGTSKTSDQILK